MRVNAKPGHDTGPSLGGDISKGVLWLAWHAVRLPVLALLGVLEPVVRFVLMSVATLSVLVAGVLRFSGSAPHFPFWGMLGFAAACALALMGYYLVIRLLSFTPSR